MKNLLAGLPSVFFDFPEMGYAKNYIENKERSQRRKAVKRNKRRLMRLESRRKNRMRH